MKFDLLGQLVEKVWAIVRGGMNLHDPDEELYRVVYLACQFESEAMVSKPTSVVPPFRQSLKLDDLHDHGNEGTGRVSSKRFGDKVGMLNVQKAQTK